MPRFKAETEHNPRKNGGSEDESKAKTKPRMCKNRRGGSDRPACRTRFGLYLAQDGHRNWHKMNRREDQHGYGQQRRTYSRCHARP